MFRLCTASLHQAMRSTGYVKPYKAWCSAVIGWFSTAVIGAFKSSLFWLAAPSVACFFVILLLLCFLIMGIHVSGISTPLSLLRLLGWSLMWIVSLTLRVYQCGSRSINLPHPKADSVQCCMPWNSGGLSMGYKCSCMSRSCSFILSCIGLPVSLM